ncbi:6-phosphofructo-2-kinase-domain-containing protein [Tuber borchii]|uniref:6-phosphofructo-2-kinase-domain-containing protein n=1 Tax=Tuber borchii TaxID=42251 RepID=A0A2T6ZDS3_TUBBO|nr:6-phosphofructo-2-kinase-domain-containing protein [Tuber borchii]
MARAVVDWYDFHADYEYSTDDVPVSRLRRRSNVNVDAIHDFPVDSEMAPAQLYSTESGRLFHSGKIAIVTVGLPARGKTHVSVALSRYLRWLGVKTHAFHLGDYRREHMGPGNDVPHDYFFVNASPSSVKLRQTILQKCRFDLYHFLDREMGQVAIYDAVNPTAEGRKQLSKEFLKHEIQTIFIESYVDDPKIIEQNVRGVKISSPDYQGWNPNDAVQDYIRRMGAKIPHFETMDEHELNYIKMINAGERIIVNNCRFGYLPNRIVFYLMNLHIKSRRTYFARSGVATGEDSYKADGLLCDEGESYSQRLCNALLEHREKEREEFVKQGGNDEELKPLTVWTSTRRRTVQTAAHLQERGFKVKQRPQMSQLNPGNSNMTEEEIKAHYPADWDKHQLDPYHHRFPRGESYHDLAVRMEPIILELEREKNDLLIIAHESVLRVLYGYLMACSTSDIPSLKFPRNEIVEILPESYNNRAKRVPIPHTDTNGAYVP